MENSFRFRQFEVRHARSALKVGTDAVLLGASATVRGDERSILDIGTGSGVIALMLAQRSQAGLITGIDIDPPSAEEAALNFSLSPWRDRLQAVCTALSDFVPGNKYDLIVSNPPYYDSSLRNPDARKAAARHSDTLDLTSLCSFSSEWLSSCGRMSAILPEDRLTSLIRTAASFGLTPFRIMHVRTTAAKAPSRAVAEFSLFRADPSEEYLTLTENGRKTLEYTRLTEDFYL